MARCQSTHATFARIPHRLVVQETQLPPMLPEAFSPVDEHCLLLRNAHGLLPDPEEHSPDLAADKNVQSREFREAGPDLFFPGYFSRLKAAGDPVVAGQVLDVVESQLPL